MRVIKVNAYKEYKELNQDARVIKVNAYEYKELNQDAKHEVVSWLDQDPIEIFSSFADMEDIDIQKHCEANEYLFTKTGKCVHHLEIKEEDK